MIVYTIQPLEVLKKLYKGQYKPQKRFIEPSFVRAYQWYMDQAQIKDYPIWVWVDRPDLRSFKNFRDPKLKLGKNKFALITLEVPEELVTLSDFGLWHQVLNNVAVSYNETEYDKFQKLSQKQIEKTWKRILYKNKNSYNKFDPEWIGKIRLQGIIEKIDPKMIIKAHIFEINNKKID